MSTRSHWTTADALNMSVLTREALAPYDSSDDIDNEDEDYQALVLEDAGNMEAFVIRGTDDELLRLADDIRERVTKGRHITDELHDPITGGMTDDQLAAHNEAMENDPQYRDAIYYERN